MQAILTVSVSSYWATFKLLYTHDINLPDLSFLPSVLSRPLFASGAASTCGAGTCGTGTTAFYLQLIELTRTFLSKFDDFSNHASIDISAASPY